jgi:hypothetical protein
MYWHPYSDLVLKVNETTTLANLEKKSALFQTRQKHENESHEIFIHTFSIA